jgi:hypothetical protein
MTFSMFPLHKIGSVSSTHQKGESFCVFGHSQPTLLKTKNGTDTQTITALPQYT